MPQITRNSGFSTQDIVTATKLHNLVDTAVISKELLTAQTALPYGTVAVDDYMLSYDVSTASMRTITAESLLNSTLSTTFGNTQITGTEFLVTVNEGGSTLNFNSNLGVTNFEVSSANTAKVDSNTITLNTSNLLLTLNNDDSKKVIESKFWPTGNVTPAREEKDVTIDIRHPASDNPDSKTYLTTDNNTVVEFKGPVKNTGQVRFMNPEILIGEGEDEETFNLASPPYKGLYDIQVSIDETVTEFNIHTGDIPNSGSLLLNQSITVPTGEVWYVRYEANVAYRTDDELRVLYKRDNTVICTFTTRDYVNNDNGSMTTFVNMRLAAGTYTITARGGFVFGGNRIAFYGLGGIHRTIHKFYV